MTRNRRYEASFDALNDRRIAEAPPSACTLPSQAYGPQPLAWAPHRERPAVWAWISWPNRPAERIAAYAKGWNDRVVNVEWADARGTHDTMVWRNAVTLRTTTDTGRRTP